MVRLLGPGDEPAIEAFLLPRLETSMFPLSNLDQAGIVDRGEPFQGAWAGAGEPLTAVVLHGSWNGALMVQGDEGLEEAVLLAVRTTGRPVTVITGPDVLVERARTVLGLPRGPLEPEILYTLDLSDLVVPPAPGVVRPPTEVELEDPLLDWRIAYVAEALGLKESREAVLTGLRRARRAGRSWVLEVEGELVACSHFNAVTRDVVQVGGVWTPPALRSRGYGRAVVAGTLLLARAQGMRRSVLFTDSANFAAQRAYEALGFVRRGRFGLWLPPS